MQVSPWLIAFLEGFSTLAVEVIAIRLAIPVVGSSITLTGVMLGVVLFALSAGYWRGGVLSAQWDQAQTRRRLMWNLLCAAVLYGALAFPFEAPLLEKALDAGFSLPMAIGLTASLLLLIPIYLASQTVPMLAELTNVDGKAGKASGKVLFYSTIGSVAGGVVTPVWLFPAIGVTRSGFVVCILLALVAAAVAIDMPAMKRLGTSVAALAVVGAAQALTAPRNDLYSFDSAYQSIRIVEEPDENGRKERLLMMGGGRASGIYADSGETSFAYTIAVRKAIEQTRAQKVLIIGAAGFTLPRDAANLAAVTQVDAVDVDPVVLPIAQEHFLKQKLSPKIRFLPLSARYAVRRLHGDGLRYGFTLIDAFFGRGIPDELVTKEFYRDVRLISEHTAVNVIMDADLMSAFAVNLLATFREAFGAVWVKQVKPSDSGPTNMLITDWPTEGATLWTGSGAVYRDDKNTADRDHVAMVWGPEPE